MALLGAIVAPMASAMRTSSGIDQSLANLQAIGVAHALYGLEWNDRQPTLVRDDLDAFGPDATSAFQRFEVLTGTPHPPVVLGWGPGDRPEDPPLLHQWTSPHLLGIVATPMRLELGLRFGAFRLMNARPLHDYLNGRFYDELFYAPRDEVLRDEIEAAGGFDSPWEYEPIGGPFDPTPIWTSYCWSPAAMYDPAVLRGEAEGGFQAPFHLDGGLASPAFSAARYPSLKTHIIEHNALQAALPSPCNPAWSPGSYGECVPWYFNHLPDSAPASLMYDGSTRLLPNADVRAVDQALLARTGEGLWHRGTPLGTDGYWIDAGEPGIDLSHHVLTIDGILGRDITAGVPDGPGGEPLEATPGGASW